MSEAALTEISRVVVIGSGGFIGRNFVALLQQHKVPHLAIAGRQLDLTSPGAASALAALLQQGDSLVMLSALTPDRARGVPALQANIAMMAAVAAACERIAPTHFTYVSSDAVYPMTSGLVTENTPAQASDLYSAMHLAREQIVSAAMRVPAAILRPTLVYGLDDTHNSYGPNRLRRMAHGDGTITLFGVGEERRDHVYVADLCRLLFEVVSRKFVGTLNVATGRSVSYAELAAVIARQFLNPIEIKDTARQNPITHRHFDPTRLLKAFPRFAFTPLEDGLKEVHQAMLAQGKP